MADAVKDKSNLAKFHMWIAEPGVGGRSGEETAGECFI